MKLVCEPCDEQMKLHESKGPDEGSLSMAFGCPACGHKTIILTNPLETQMVKSLGVEVCPMGSEAAPSEPAGLVREMLASKKPDAFAGGDPSDAIPWDAAAAERIERVPSFIRPMVRKSIAKYARDKGYESVTEAVMDEAKSKMSI